ncbi:MAG: rod shape-determining protein MreD [Actinomycetia bacterium]|nr:rod shape-determining protein MreD [Actinomycetes bacterium]
MWQYHWLTWVVAPLAALVVETTLLPLLFPPGYVPDLVLATVVALALFESPVRGAALGAIAGLLVDLAAGRMWGLNLGVDAAVGAAVAVLQSKIVRDAVFVPGLVGALAQVVAHLLDWIATEAAGLHFALGVFMRPTPVWILFGLFFTPALVTLLGLRPRHEVDERLRF